MEITRENFTKAMEEAVAERGEDYVYPDSEKDEYGTCQYVVDGKPSCIVGVALAKLGSTFNFPNRGANEVLYAHFNVEDDRLREAAGEAQHVQDNDGTWGEALKTFKRFLEAANA